jgi:hypothetical protein
MKWSANWGHLHIIVCNMHREAYAKELSRIRRSKESYACYFCVRLKVPPT